MQPFVIPVAGLKEGKTTLEWRADSKFFGSFENSEVMGADLEVKVAVDCTGSDWTAECFIKGTVEVICDRCLEKLTLPVETSFGTSSDESFLGNGEGWDLSQDIYDYVCISLPVRRCHPEGECDAEMLKYLSK